MNIQTLKLPYLFRLKVIKETPISICRDFLFEKVVVKSSNCLEYNHQRRILHK